MNTFNIFLCDDDSKYLAILSHIIQNSALILSNENYNFNFVLKTTDYSELLKVSHSYFTEHNIYFLDVDLKSAKTGVDIAEELHKYDPKGQLIFVTSFQDFAIQTYQRRINALDYILKNNNIENLQRRITDSLQQAIVNFEQQNLDDKLIFSYKLGTQIFNININEIYYISTGQFDHELKLVRESGITYFRDTINNLLSNYPALIKISRSCIINPKNVTTIDFKKRKIIFPANETVTYSIRYSRALKNYFLK